MTSHAGLAGCRGSFGWGLALGQADEQGPRHAVKQPLKALYGRRLRIGILT